MAPNNTLTCWGNEKTMNLNNLILTNIQSSPYFKVNLYELKTYHEVIDEIYYKVSHLEPWEKGSRKTAGQTGMCGGVRGVGAGGIVSSAYCLLYKLFTLKLTRKQVTGLIEHADSPYIRGLGFMYIRYSQDPKELWDWYEPYFDDDEEVDVKAGGGHVMTMGEIVRQLLTKLEWYCTLFPRIPVPVQKEIDRKMKEYLAFAEPPAPEPQQPTAADRHIPDEDVNFGEAEKYAANAAIRRRSPTPPHRQRARSPPRKHTPPRRRSVTPPPRRRSASPPRHRSHRSPHRSPPRRSPPRYRRSQPRYRSRSPRRRSPGRRSPDDFAKELQREKERQAREKDSPKAPDRESSREKERRKTRSKSRDRHRRSKHRSRSRERKRSRSRSPHKKKHKSHKDRRRSRSRDRNGV